MTEEEKMVSDKGKPIALGLIFGVVGGIVFGPMIFDDPSTGIGLGISMGLVFGAAYSQTKKHVDKEDGVAQP
jgi:drug/metabolite transporter (DMT)-like permease